MVLTADELAEILAEELELPRIEPKGQRASKSQKHKYKGISTQGPESLRHNKRTYRNALKRNRKYLYRVYIGPKFERGPLDKMRPEVDREFGVESMVVRYIP